MLVDLETLRPQNESYEHFILKQVGRAWLFRKGLRYIGCEVNTKGLDESPFGRKTIADVVGIERRRKQQPSKVKLYQMIRNLAIQHGENLGLTQDGWGGRREWISTFSLRGEQKYQVESSINACYREACRELGLHEEAYKTLSSPYHEELIFNLIEAKASVADFRNGFCVAAEYTYIIAPIGVIPLEELPDKVGLLEFDFDKFHETKDWETALVVTKRPKRGYDSYFLTNPENPKSLDVELHQKYCEDLVYSVAQENTEETIFWNPFLRHIPDGGDISSETNWRFKYDIGDETPLGIIIERRIRRKSEEEYERESRAGISRAYRSIYSSYYKLVVAGEGITEWISERVIKESFKLRREEK